MAEANESGMAPLRRDAVVASDLIAMRELLKAEAQAIHQLAQTAIQALDESTDAQIEALTHKVEALHKSQGERIETVDRAHNERSEASHKASWDRIKDADGAARERVGALQEQLQVIERLAVERLDSVRREIILMQQNSAEAISKAAAANERRFESVNEFRAQQGDLIKTFATKSDIKALSDALDKVEEREKELEQWRSNTEGRQAIRTVLWPVLVGVVVFILTQVMRIAFPILPKI